MPSQSSAYRHPDIRKFDGIRSCLACGTTIFEPQLIETPPQPVSHANSNQARKYEYKKLNYELGQEIRLLIIEPGAREGSIHCNIITVNLLDNPPCEALSYTWATENGDSTVSRTVYVRNGAMLPITANCEAAIQRLRKLGSPRRLWIDALCIDQNNMSERNHQVALMGQIYKGASRVLVYLDRGEYGFTTMFDWLNDQRKSEMKTERHTVPSLLHVIPEELLGLRWFHCVWVIQQVALARATHLLTTDGYTVLDHSTVERLHFLFKLNYKQEKPLPGLLRWTPGQRDLEKPDILSWLWAIKDCSASDARDKVFRLLSLIPPREKSLIPVDYSMELVTVCIYAAAAFIAQRSNLDVLAYSRWGCDNDPSSSMAYTSSVDITTDSEWPSWVPDWRQIELRAICPFGRDSSGPWRSSKKKHFDSKGGSNTTLYWLITGPMAGE